ncbi:hypothetical protein ABPG75_004351 [Micractinium tetrahymenae]
MEECAAGARPLPLHCHSGGAWMLRLPNPLEQTAWTGATLPTAACCSTWRGRTTSGRRARGAARCTACSPTASSSWQTCMAQRWPLCWPAPSRPWPPCCWQPKRRRCSRTAWRRWRRRQRGRVPSPTGRLRWRSAAQRSCRPRRGRPLQPWTPSWMLASPACWSSSPLGSRRQLGFHSAPVLQTHSPAPVPAPAAPLLPSERWVWKAQLASTAQQAHFILEAFGPPVQEGVLWDRSPPSSPQPWRQRFDRMCAEIAADRCLRSFLPSPASPPAPGLYGNVPAPSSSMLQDLKPLRQKSLFGSTGAPAASAAQQLPEQVRPREPQAAALQQVQAEPEAQPQRARQRRARLSSDSLAGFSDDDLLLAAAAAACSAPASPQLSAPAVKEPPAPPRMPLAPCQPAQPVHPPERSAEKGPAARTREGKEDWPPATGSECSSRWVLQEAARLLAQQGPSQLPVDLDCWSTTGSLHARPARPAQSRLSPAVAATTCPPASYVPQRRRRAGLLRRLLSCAQP